MRLSPPNGNNNGFTMLASFVLVAAVLYFAKEVLIPIALASLLSFLLAPLVVRLSKLGLGKIGSIIVVVAGTSAVLAVIAWLVMVQLIHLADQLPKYQQNLDAKVQSFRKPHSSGVLGRASGVIQQLRKEMDSLSQATEDTTTPGLNPAVDRPLPVEIKRPKPTPVAVISAVVGPVLRPMATAGAVVFFVILMLFQREDLRERFLKLVSRGELSVATQAVDDAAQRVSRYLLMQLIVNATYGLPIGIGLYFIGVPNAFLWGLLATLLRFIPFLGPWIAASFPVVLAFAVDPGWTKIALTVGLYLFVELISNNIVEPWLYGASTGISNFALLVAAIFWTWLWGTVGLLLSTPLTVCLLVLGKYVPGLRFLSVLLGSEPVLEPEARFYQRMLAMEEDELYSISERFIKAHSLAELYDTILVPALGLAEQDRYKGALTEVRQAFILQTTRELVESLGRSPTDKAEDQAQAVADRSAAAPVLCLPARDEADELAAMMLAQLLEKKGISARFLSAKALASEWLKQIRTDQTGVVCISGIPPFAVTPARHICQRLKQEVPTLKVVAGIWNATAPLTEIANRIGSSGPDALVSRLPDAIARIESLLEADRIARERSAARPTAATLPTPVAAPATPPAEAEPEEIFALITRQAAKVLNVPVSLVSLVDTDTEFWRAHGGVPPDLAAGEALHESLAPLIGGSPDIIEIADLAEDPRLATDTLLRERGIRFLCGIPLRSSDGHLVGSLCLTDIEPHQVSDRVSALLKSLGERLVQEVERRAPAAPVESATAQGDEAAATAELEPVAAAD